MDQATARRLLGVPAGATRAEIEAAFRCRAMSTHPDRGGQAEAFRSVVDAHRTLMHPRTGSARGTTRVTPVTVVADQSLVRQLVVSVMRRLLARSGPHRRVV